MAPRSSEPRQHFFEAKASFAAERAVTAPTPQLAERWRHIAETYRWIAYHRRAFGKWQPPPDAAGGHA